MNQAVWRALGDPTRRQILDFLRRGPITTGDLAAQFAQTRFGIMKHLTVLEEANLILVRRQGRKRWNHLNAVPLREIYERWLGPYQEFWSTTLLRLRDNIAAREPSITEENAMSEFNSFEIHQEITLPAPVEKVWAALTTDIGQWWAFRVGEEGSTISLDPRLGGRFEERWGDGEGVIWGQVLDLRRGKRLRLKGNLGMAGAGSNDYVYELEEQGDKTRLKLSHHAVGYRDPDTHKNYEEGWNTLFHTYLTPWLAEGKPAEQVKAEAED